MHCGVLKRFIFIHKQDSHTKSTCSHHFSGSIAKTGLTQIVNTFLLLTSVVCVRSNSWFCAKAANPCAGRVEATKRQGSFGVQKKKHKNKVVFVYVYISR